MTRITRIIQGMAPCGAGAVFFFRLTGLNLAIDAMVAPGEERAPANSPARFPATLLGRMIVYGNFIFPQPDRRKPLPPFESPGQSAQSESPRYRSPAGVQRDWRCDRHAAPWDHGLRDRGRVQRAGDCCLYDWFEDGKKLVQRYAEAHPANRGTDEAYLFTAYRQAVYRILTVQSRILDAGLYCYDVLNEEELFLMDLAFSRSLGHGITALATRTVPLGEYWMTGGAALPIASAYEGKFRFGKIDKRTLDSRDGVHSLPPLIVRACLAAGASEHIRYEGSGPRARLPRVPESKRKHRWY